MSIVRRFCTATNLRRNFVLSTWKEGVSKNKDSIVNVLLAGVLVAVSLKNLRLALEVREMERVHREEVAELQKKIEAASKRNSENLIEVPIREK
jgi:uncharacterized membrane protein (DUF106 family)